MAIAKRKPGRPDRETPPVDGGLIVNDVTPFCVGPSAALKSVIATINTAGEGLALVVDDERHLLGTVTDGDIRRAILAGVDLDLPVEKLVAGGPGVPRRAPVTAKLGSDAVRLLVLMSEYAVRHIPLLDGEDHVAALALLSRLVRNRELPLSAVIMAGGLGTRLRPLTADTPKPMLPVGDRPLIERTIERLAACGIGRVNITTHYLGGRIEELLGDGSGKGVSVSYTREEAPLGTAGGLRGIESDAGGPLLVINGDVLTTVDYRAMLDFHRDHQAEITMGVRPFSFTIPFGVVEAEGALVKGLKEKPTLCHFVNAGVYLVEASASVLIPAEGRYDMTDLVQALLDRGRRVVGFPIHEYWLDIGQHDDYARAQRDAAAGTLDS